MDISIFTASDLEEISAHGMTPDDVLEQIRKFKKGMAFTKIIKPCTIKDGIRVLDATDIEKYVEVFTDAQNNGRSMKFVPASGAASRMFKTLLGTYNDLNDENGLRNISSVGDADEKLSAFIKWLEKYAFYNDLKSKIRDDGEELETCIRNGHIKTVLEYLLFEKGLNLSNLPKGLIPFHMYDDHSRTPFEEHLIEAFNYVKDRDGTIKIHFTVSPEHEKKVREFFSRVISKYETGGIKFSIELSSQKPSTATIAVDLDNMPFRDENGALFFRPGGHGSLIENLSGLKGDIIFIKNIDNVTTDRFKDQTFTYKKALGGFLISLQKEIFGYLRTLGEGQINEEYIEMLFNFIRNELCLIPPEDLLNSSLEDKKKFLARVLDRPLRVCGMVKNTGHPGGGPFWVEQPGKGISIQIVESSQIDMNKAEQKKIFLSSTHFNPVDLVCGVRDYRGKPFDLRKYVDHDAGFISLKSKNGRELKAMELPGLWNGAMAYWNSVFIEVPAGTFNPVKTVFDLVNDGHQSQ